MRGPIGLEKGRESGVNRGADDPRATARCIGHSLLLMNVFSAVLNFGRNFGRVYGTPAILVITY
jgi:hypothetical protein